MITAAYQSALNRAPTAAELAANTSTLIAGISSDGMIFSKLAFSAASGVNVAAMYQQVIGQVAPQSMVTTLEQCLCIGANPLTLLQLKTDLGAAAKMYQRITGLPVTADALSPLLYDFLNKSTLDGIAFRAIG